MDTCGPRPRVALRVDGRITTEVPEELGARADDAASLAGRLLREAGLTAAELTGIGVTIGPGSYTGVRIGLALVRGLSIVDRVRVVGVGTLELLAASAAVHDSSVCTVLDAGADKLYVAVFALTDGETREVLQPKVVSRSQLEDFLAGEAGDAVLVRSEDEPYVVSCDRPILAVPGAQRIATLASLAARRLQQGGGSSADRVLPLYVGATGAQPNRNKVVTTTFPDE